MGLPGLWNRRQVLQGAGSVAALSGVAAVIGSAATFGQAQPKHFAYVGSHEDGGSIHVFAVTGDRWTRVQTIGSALPVALALHPGKDVLYAANEIATWRGLPCGSIEAFAIDAEGGSLVRISEEPLALSATMPRGLALSPDGRRLVVAVYGGGAYNILPIGEDGGLGRVTGIVKELGAGPHPEHQRSAHPHTVSFPGNGKYMLGTDAGSDRLNTFAFEEGVLRRTGHADVARGSGPGAMVLHPRGDLLLVANQWNSTLASFTWDAVSGVVGAQLHTASLPGKFEAGSQTLVAMHPSGDFLYASSSSQTGSGQLEISGWKIDTARGKLSQMSVGNGVAGSCAALRMSPEGDGLMMLDGMRGEVLQRSINRANGRLGRAQRFAAVPQARCIAMKTLTDVRA